MGRANRRTGRRLLGATLLAAGMLIALPGVAGAGNHESEHKVTICHRTNSVTNPYEVIEVDAESLEGDSPNPSDHSSHIGLPFDFDADPDVAYPEPRNGDQWGDIIPAFDFGDISFVGLNWTEEGIAIHEAGCEAPPPPPETTLTVTKVVDGDAAPADWTYGFTTSVGDFSLTDEAPTNGPVDVTPDTEIVVAEDDAGGATTTTIECTDAVAVPGQDGLSVTVTVAEGDAAACTFTNTFVPELVAETGSLTVTKVATGAGAPDTWTFPFDGGALGTFDLTNAAPTAVFDELDAGVFVIEETDAGTAGLTDIDCGDANAVVAIADDASDGAVTVTLAEGEDVVCTFTNDFPEVLGDVVTRTPTTTTTTTTQPTAVLDSTVTRTLPRTGSGSLVLTLVGSAMVLLGGGLTFGGRRLEATR